MRVNNKLVVRCCYLGMFVQAVIINLTPVLFIPLREQLGLSFEQIGRLVLINFTTQITFDLICGALVSRTGPRPLVLASGVLASLGLALFALLPGWMAEPYHGLIIGTIVFSMGGGILEMVLSPIINAVPSEKKEQDMALLHSFYAWGNLTVVLSTALAVFWLGPQHWPWIVLFWAVVPAVNVVGFAFARLPAFVEEQRRTRLRVLITQPVYIAAVIGIGLAGATEVTINQWLSAFADVGLGLPKIVGDVFGLSLFALALGIGRVWFGIWGEKVDVSRILIAGAWLSVAVYVVASVSPWPYISLAACVLAGLGVSLLWPGMLSLAAARFPLAGASMFAFMAASGDSGAAVAPWLLGALADRIGDAPAWLLAIYGSELTSEQIGLRAGLLLSTVFPLALLGLLYWLRRTGNHSFGGR